jgi:hypothetical protein
MNTSWDVPYIVSSHSFRSIYSETCRRSQRSLRRTVTFSRGSPIRSDRPRTISLFKYRRSLLRCVLIPLPKTVPCGNLPLSRKTLTNSILRDGSFPKSASPRSMIYQWEQRTFPESHRHRSTVCHKPNPHFSLLIIPSLLQVNPFSHLDPSASVMGLRLSRLPSWTPEFN